ncbi:MAG: hypothetical protein IKH64_02320, partial [Prevotella sp.]|nr:hypothetical protein [Prevotella sp.]
GTDATTADLTADATAVAATAGTDATAAGIDTGSTTKTKTIEEPIDNYKERLSYSSTQTPLELLAFHAGITVPGR